MYTVEFVPAAKADLKALRPYDARIVLDAIDIHLVHEPNVESPNRKKLRENPLATWEMRVGNFRVFYEVNEDEFIVVAVAIGEKRREKVFLRGVEYDL